jgi:hypothetical protein
VLAGTALGALATLTAASALTPEGAGERAPAAAASAAGEAAAAGGDGSTGNGRGGAGGAFGAPVVIDLPATDPGYHLVSTNGDVTPFGSASFEGGALATVAPVTGTARAPGEGYWQVDTDGGVHSFGGAPFHGSAAGTPLVSPVVAMAATVGGDGYWLTSADGGVFAFGAAPWAGSAAGTPLVAPVVDVAASPAGAGYWLVTADGGVFPFGDAPFVGSLAGTPPALADRGRRPLRHRSGPRPHERRRRRLRPRRRPVRRLRRRGRRPRPRGGRGPLPHRCGVLARGQRRGRVRLRRRTVPRLGRRAPQDRPDRGDQRRPRRPAGPTAPSSGAANGHDISWPQCDGELPAQPYGHGIVGVTGGRPFTVNRCLDQQHAWSLAGGSGAGLYVNLAFPKADAPEAATGPRGTCEVDDRRCRAYNYGANTISAALAHAAASGASAPMWWLDVEEANHWSSDLGANQDVVLGAIEALRDAGIDVGVYSTRRMWRDITGDMQVRLPVWVAGAPTDEAAPRWCNPHRSFGGGEVWLVQSLPVRYDVNWACDPLTAAPGPRLPLHDDHP